MIDPRWGFNIVQDTETNTNTEQVPDNASQVFRYLPFIVWKGL
jgi:hypothetical protein